jgi:hypothetical protein
MEQQAGLAYACYFLLGSGILAPWNAFITGEHKLKQFLSGTSSAKLFELLGLKQLSGPSSLQALLAATAACAQLWLRQHSSLPLPCWPTCFAKHG